MTTGKISLRFLPHAPEAMDKKSLSPAYSFFKIGGDHHEDVNQRDQISDATVIFV